MRAPIVDIRTVRTRFDRPVTALLMAAGAAGVVLLLVSLLLSLGSDEARNRAASAYLTSFLFYLTLSLGALFFVLLHHLVRADWSVVVRRIAEAIAANLILVPLLAIPVVLSMARLYDWAAPGAVERDHLLAAKAAYLNPGFFLVRMVVYLGAWAWMAFWYLRRSAEQDETGDLEVTGRMERWSAPAMVVLAITMFVASIDLVMSLDPHWYSTMIGVYLFAGSAVGFFAFLAVVTGLLIRFGYLRRAMTAEHFHDIGKLVFAFTVFWAYIAFSQYMLIWYANIPEETEWYHRRQTAGWGAMSLLLLFGHFIVPFLALLPRFVKRNPRLLFAPALWVLAMHWIDIYWLVMPEAQGGQGTAAPRLVDITCLLGLGGIYVAAAGHWLRARAIVPVKDPRLEESLAFESV